MASTKAEPLIDFVPSKDIVSTRNRSKKTHQVRRKADVNGDEIRDFYEGLILEKTQSETDEAEPNKHLELKDTKEKRSEKLNKSSSVTLQRCSSSQRKYPSKDKHCILEKSKAELRLLQCSQDGDVNHVVSWIEKGVDINVQDQYGWTPLMCSAYEGHNEVVSVLLKAGADWTLCERKGRTACDLAKLIGHHSTVKLLDNVTDTSEMFMSENSKQDEGFYCDVCKKQFFEGSFRSHSSSTVHLFNRQLKPPEPSYLIAESNVGYQMMLRSGWNTSHGLGPHGEGHKYPVKTLLKRDRKGLGMEQANSPRVTHFRPGDVQAVKSVTLHGERRESMRTVSRRAVRRERRDREWEKRLRQYMNSD